MDTEQCYRKQGALHKLYLLYTVGYTVAASVGYTVIAYKFQQYCLTTMCSTLLCAVHQWPDSGIALEGHGKSEENICFKYCK